MGLTKLFMYPSQVVRMNAVTPGWQSISNFVHIASIMLHVKNGTQHMRNTPEMVEKGNRCVKLLSWEGKNNRIHGPKIKKKKFFLIFSNWNQSF